MIEDAIELHWFKGQTPSEWCKKMMDEAQDGDEAMAYFELMNIWKELLKIYHKCLDYLMN